VQPVGPLFLIPISFFTPLSCSARNLRDLLPYPPLHLKGFRRWNQAGINRATRQARRKGPHSAGERDIAKFSTMRARAFVDGERPAFNPSRFLIQCACLTFRLPALQGWMADQAVPNHCVFPRYHWVKITLKNPQQRH
jgi:hypothetical protein